VSAINDLQSELENARDRLAQLEAQLAEAMAILREVEWKGTRDKCRACPSCNGFNSDGHYGGHRSDCRLKKALGDP
jgi:hypothetical protein